MRRFRRGVLLAAGLMSGGATCTDAPVAPNHSPAASMPAHPQSESVFSLFTVELTSAHTATSGSWMEIEVCVRANAAARNALVRLVLPEVEAARMPGGASGFRPTMDARLGALWEKRVDLGAGDEIRHAVRVPLPESGYYRVVLSAQGESSPVDAGAQPIQPFASREIWLLVREDGVDVTNEFDPRRVPSGMRAEPGPFRPLSGPEASASAPARDASLTYTPPPQGDGQYEGVVWFYDDYYGAFKTVPGVQVDFSYYSYDYGNWVYAGSQSYVTDAHGNIYFHCNLDQTRQRVEVDVVFWSDDVYVDGGGYHGVFGSCLEFGQDIGFAVSKHHARAFLNLRQTAATSYSVFGVRRYQLNANVNTVSSGGGGYSPSTDEVTLWNDAIWGPNGVRIAAHQYGHALHFKALGGYVSGSCPSTELPLAQGSDQYCAYAEGFAEFYAAALCTAENNFAAVRSPSITTGMDGSLVGGSIAAFLYDLYDSTDDAGEVGAGRYFDSISLPGTYLATVMRTCRTTHLSGISGQFPETIDRLIACLENNSNIYTPSYFPAMHRVTAYSEQAAEPAGWSQPAIRSLWLYDLYGQ